jgi:hypothetical protein
MFEQTPLRKVRIRSSRLGKTVDQFRIFEVCCQKNVLSDRGIQVNFVPNLMCINRKITDKILKN